jgi:transcriptional regulator with XRE-family HTH domain
MTEFKHIIRMLRKLRGWSQERMARAIDLSREQVSRLESGINKPQPRTIDRLAEVFGLPAERLRPPLMAEEKIEDLLAIAKMQQQVKKSSVNLGGLGQFAQFVMWFRAMNRSDQSLTLAALQKIHEETAVVKVKK